MKYSSLLLSCLIMALFLFQPVSVLVTTNASSGTSVTLKAAISVRTEISSETMEIEFPTPVLGSEIFSGRKWDTLTMEDTIMIPMAGYPRLPVKIVPIENVHLIENVEVSYTGPVYSDIELIPVHKALSPYSPEDPEVINTTAYSSDSYLPDEEYKITNLGGVWRDGYRYWCNSLALFPVRYNPVRNCVITYGSAEVHVTYDTTSPVATQSFFSNTPDRDENDNEVTRGSGTRADVDPQYIIITTTSFVTPLQTLAAWKTKKGVPCEVRTTSNIYNSYSGSDNPEKIRNFIKDMHDSHNIKYVLLAGDYTEIPVRSCRDPHPVEGWDDGWIPADSYYACLDGTWNNDGDGYWGENGDITDIYADVYLSRIAIRSYSKMSQWVQGVIDYEKSPSVGTWMEKAILIGADSHNVGDGATQCEYLYDNYLKNCVSNPVKLYENGGTISRNTLKANMNSGASYINFVDHGGPSTWCQNGGNEVLFNSNDVGGLTNGRKKPLISAMACLTSWFDNPSGCGYDQFSDCIGEVFTENVQNGAIAYIGSSRSAIAVIGQGYYYGAGGLQEDLCIQLANKNLHIGEAHHDAKNRYAYVWGNWFSDTQESSGEVQACWLELNMLGEPEVPLWMATPNTFQVNVTLTQERINVTVTDTATGSEVQGARVCIQGGDHYLNGITTRWGKVSFVNPMVEGSADLTVTRSGYIPYESFTPFIDTTPPSTEYSVDPGEPTGENGWYNTIPVLTFTSEEGATIRYSYEDDENSYMVYSEPVKVRNGDNRIYYYSEDIWENREVASSLILRVDTAAPSSNILVNPEEPTGTGGWYVIAPTISLNPMEDDGSEEEDVEIYYRVLLDGEPLGEFTLYTGEIYLDREGEITIEYYGIDAAGNYEKMNSKDFRLDFTPPEVQITVDREPEGADEWYVETPEIQLFSTSSDDLIYWYFDNGTHYPYTRTIKPDEGDHTLHCYSVDQAGNIGDEQVLDLKVDTTPPETTCIITPEYPDGFNSYYINRPEIILTSEPNSTIHYSWDNIEFEEYDVGEGIALRSEGMIELFYYSVDPAGNTGILESRKLLIDLTRPLTTIMLEPEEPNGKMDWFIDLEIELTSTFKDTQILYYYFDNVSLKQKYKLPLSKADIPQGIHTLYYYAIDHAGNQENVRSMELKFDSKAPLPQLDMRTEGVKAGDEIVFTAYGSTDECSLKAYKIDFGDGKQEAWTTRRSFTHTYSSGKDYKVTLWVQDEAGHIGQKTRTVEVGELSLMEKINNYRDEEPAISYGILILLITFFLIIIITFIAVRRMRRKKRNAAERSGDTGDHEEDLFQGPEQAAGPKLSSSSLGIEGSEQRTEIFFDHPSGNETITSFFESESGRTTGAEDHSEYNRQPVPDHDSDKEIGSLEQTYENLKETLDSIFEDETKTDNYSLPISTESSESLDPPALLALPQGKHEDEAVEDFSVRVVKYPKEKQGKTKKISKKRNTNVSGTSGGKGDGDSLDGWDI